MLEKNGVVTPFGAQSHIIWPRRPRTNDQWGPVPITRPGAEALEKAGWKAEIWNLVEAQRKAFAAQACAVNKGTWAGILHRERQRIRRNCYRSPIWPHPTRAHFLTYAYCLECSVAARRKGLGHFVPFGAAIGASRCALSAH